MVFGLVVAAVLVFNLLAGLEVNLIMEAAVVVVVALLPEVPEEQQLLEVLVALELEAVPLRLALNLEVVAVVRMEELLRLVLPVKSELLYSPHNFWRTQI